jgi:hypothetical protein
VTDGTSELDRVQRFVLSRLRSRSALPRDPETTLAASALLAGNDRLTPVEQLEIYRVQFWLRHTSSLLEDFPGLAGILGQTAWESLVEDYLSELAPDSFTLRNLGQRLPEYIAGRPATPEHELCLDMARLEWAYVEIFDAEDSAPLDTALLFSIPEAGWHGARFVLSPALRLLSVRYPVAGLRRRLRLAALSGSDEPVEVPDRAPECLALYRNGERELFYKVLDPVAFAVLERLGAGEPLVSACEAVVADAPEHEAHIERSIGTWFREWGERGFFREVLPG